MLLITLYLFRYLNTGNGFVIYSPNRKKNKAEKNGRSAGGGESKMVVGTGFDKVVLQVAMRSCQRQDTQLSRFRQCNTSNYTTASEISMD